MCHSASPSICCVFLGEINDVEVIWLRWYLHPTMRGNEEFRAKHEQVLAPRFATMRSSQEEIDKETLQDSYKGHLTQLGLLRPKYKIDRRTNLPEVDNRGNLRTQGYELTRLGRLLLRHIGFEDPLPSASKGRVEDG